MNGNNTVPGTAPAGAVPASGYYSRPDLWVDAQKYADEADATYLRLKHLEGGLQTRSKEIEGMGNALKYLQYRLEIAAKTGDDALIENARQRYDQMYEKYKIARMDYARNYGEYSRAYSGYQTAWNAQNDYVTSQKSAEQQWRSTIRDPETVRSELAAIEGQIAAQRETDRAKRQAEYEAAQKAKPWYEKLAGYLGEAQDTTLPTYTNQGANVGGNSPELQALLEQQKLLQEEYEWAMYLPYADLMQNEDFAKKSVYNPQERKEQRHMDILMDNYSDNASGWEDPLYEFINGNKEAGAYLSNAGAGYYGPDNAIGAFFGRATENKAESQQMKEDEIAIFNYLYATQGRGAAHNFYSYLQSNLNYRQRKAEEEYWKAEAQKNPWGTSAFSVAMSPLNGLSYVGQLSDYIGDGKIDQNAAYNKFSYTPSAIREQVAEDIKASAKTEFWGSVGSFGYQTAMSMADFLTTALVSGGNSTLAMAIMGSGAAADTVIDAKDRGLSDHQAFALGTIAGVAEALAEKKSLSSLLDLSKLEKSAWGYVVKNMADEGLEEVTTSLVNTVADILISQDKSQWQLAIDAYMADGKTEGQAFGLALADQALALGLDALGGALSGGVMAGGNVAINKGAAAIANRLDKKAQTEPQGAAEVPAAAAPATFQEEVQRQVAENMGAGKAAQGATAQLAAPTVQVSQDVWQQGQRLAQITGRNIKFYEGKASENGFFDPKTGEIWVNAKGGDPLAQVFSHELTHSIERAGPYAKLSSLVLNRMQDAGMDLDTAREAKRQQYQRQGRSLPTQAAVDQELVAEYVSKHLLTDEAAIRSLVQQDRSLGQKIHDFFDRLLAKLGNKNAQERAFLSRAKNTYAKALRQTQAADMGAAGTVQTEAAQPAGKSDADVAGNDFLDNLDAQLAAGEITEEEYDGIREEYERWKEDQYSAGERKYSLGDTQIQQIQGIGRKSINQFSSADIQATEQLAKQYWREMGIKSPFFRGWFGDWREGDQTPIQIADQRGDTRGIQKNGDTGWDINVSGKVFAESKHFAARNTSAMAYLAYINDIVRKAVLLDSFSLGNAKSENSLLMHSLYAVADIGSGPELLKLYVEEMNDPNRANTAKRAYQLQNIEKASAATGGVQGQTPSSLAVATNAIHTVADLYAAVKLHDANFQPSQASKIVNADGTPRMMYHGTKVENGDFYVFDESKAVKKGGLGLKALGKGNYFTSKKLDGTERYGSRVISAYLNIRNPFIYNGGSSFQEQVAKKLNIDPNLSIDDTQQELRNRGYDGVVQHDTNGEVSIAVTFDSHQIKSATDNIGTFDGRNPDIRYSLADEVEAETGEKQLGVASKGKMPLSEFMGQYIQEKAEPWRQGSIVDDETVRQAQKAGYPVIDGVQVIPFVTWVHCTDPIPGTDKQRNNYGLVTGIGEDGKLLVSFRNKGAKADTDTDADQTPSKKDNVAIATEYLTPVRGKYQMTQAEWESLENAMPEEADNMDLSDEERAEIDELLSRATASEETEAEQESIPIQRDALPAKAAGLLQQAERKLLWDISDRLGVPKLAGREYLTPIIQQMADEYLEKGSISSETRQLLFEKAYAQAVVVDAEFYEQYKHIKDHLRTTPVTISDRDKLDIADFNDFRKRALGSLKIVNEGGLPVDAAYQELQSMAPELFPESITHPADQLVRMYDAARSIQVTEKTLQEYYGDEEPEYRKWARNDFEEAITKAAGKLWEVRRFAEEKVSKQKETAPATEQEAMEAYLKLKKARREYEKVSAKNLLTQRDQMQVGRLLKHEILPEDLKAGKDNVKGILAVFEAKQEFERLVKLVAEYKRHLRGKARAEADELLKTANSWKDKKVGIAYSRETMERNIYDIVPDKALAEQINDKYFTPVHVAEAASTRFKNKYNARVRKLNISRKVQKGNLVSEEYAVQLLGEAQDNIRMLENARGRIKQRDGKNRSEWEAVVGKLWEENPLLDRGKIENAVKEFRKIYDELLTQMNWVRVANGYEPVNYRQGYFPHFQPGDSDSILAQFGRALGIDTRIDMLPTTINGMTHAFKPGIQWFGNAQERLGFETAYGAVEGFGKYIEGVANVIFHTQNIQNLRAFASQIRYRTSDEGIRKQVDEIYERQGLTDEEKQQLITEIYAHGKFTLSGFVAELDEYTNLLAGKKSRYDRAIEAAMGRKAYSVLKAWESRVAANMIAGNLTSALTNFIPWTQAGAQVGYIRLLRGVEQTLRATRSDDGFAGGSTFLTNRRGVDPLVQTWAQKASGIASKPMELIDSLVSESIVRAAYEQNRQQGLSEAEAMAQADAFAAGVMADRSKGSTPTLFHSTNPLMKAFTQFQLEVNNQFSEVFKDIPRRYRDKKLRELVWVLLKYFLGAWLYNWLYEKLIGRRPALDPIGMLCQFGEDWKEDGLGTAGTNLASDALGQLPFASGLTLIGVETDGGRLPASSAVMDLTAIWKAATTEGWSAKRRWKEVQDELNKLAYVVPPFGGNQVGKIYKGLKAYFQGGSYSVDSAGNEVLQYPVYKDNPGDAFASFVKATILGKSALGTAQEWVDKGFNSLGAKQTAAYQDMLEAGVSDREAYELIRQISDAKETDTMKKAAVQRDVLRKSQASGDGKAIAYYGLMASEKEWAIMDRLADMGADAGAVTDALMDMADVRAKDGSKQADVLAVISKAVLTDEEKAVLVGSVIGTEMLTEEGNLTQYAKFDYAVQNGMGVDQYIQYRASGASIDDYLELRDAGATVDDAMEAAMALQELKDSVEDPTTVQKWKAVMAGVSDPQKQMISLSVVMTDSQYAKLTTARGFGVSPADFVSANEKIAKYDRDGNGRLTQAEVTQGISNLRLTTQQKAVLWQLITGSSSAKNNPYSQAIGERVIAALEKAKTEGKKPGHSFQDEIMRQIMANMNP